MIKVLQDRSFWLALLTIIALVIGVVQPGFSMDVEAAVGMAVIMGMYLISYGLNPSGTGLIEMLKSRKFWAAVIGLAVLYLDAFHVFPKSLNTEAVIGFVTLISWYMICLALDPGAGWRKLMVSRKFWAALIGLAVTLMQAFELALPEGITPDTLLAFVLLLTGAIGKFGLEGPPPEEFPELANGA